MPETTERPVLVSVIGELRALDQQIFETAIMLAALGGALKTDVLKCKHGECRASLTSAAADVQERARELAAAHKRLVLLIGETPKS